MRTIILVISVLQFLVFKTVYCQTAYPAQSKINNSVNKLSGKSDSLILSVEEIPQKYFTQLGAKIYTYSKRVSAKTIKTLTRLASWENKIRQLLEKASPQTAAELFSKEQLTFNSLLQKVKSGEQLVAEKKSAYDAYTDKLTCSIKYIQTQKEKLDSAVIQKLDAVAGKMNTLDKEIAQAEATEQFIKERKKLLITESVKYIGKSKYLLRINKESYYYVETLKNYKEIFSDKKKTEETVLHVLNTIPAFKEFMQRNGQLASLFGTSTAADIQQAVSGLQTRTSINTIVQGRITSGGPNASQVLQQSMKEAKNFLATLKEKALNNTSNGDKEIPDFKPNEQKTRTFRQRLEYGATMQSQKAGKYFPVTSDIALTISYKINDKSKIGIGASYKIGWGSVERIRISNQGIGLRSFVDWKIKKNYFITGGYEQNYFTSFSNSSQLKQIDNWQQSGLLGISKNYSVNKKLKGKIQLLYDFLSRTHTPATPSVIYRIGYNF